MNYPYLEEMKTTRVVTDRFYGYNHNTKISDGEFFDMKNMTSANYPVLSPRQKRGIYARPQNPGGLIDKDALCYVDGSDFVINEYRVDMGLSDEIPKQLVSMGAYVIILPDKKYINTQDLSDFGNIEAGFSSAEGQTVSFELCRENGESYGNATVSSSEPVDPENLALWLDTSTTPHSLKQYSSSAGIWVQIATTFIKIAVPGIGAAFEQYDGVDISGVTEELKELNGSYVVMGRGNDYIVVTGILDNVVTQNTPVTVRRQMPAMDYVIESNNRLWGCRYGIANNGSVVNEIYASKLGDFKNWSCFMGISTDSYAASVGTDGAFTGAVNHNGFPIFFKEGCIHKIYGTEPSNFQIQNTAGRGVQKGCSGSLAIVNETLFYKARNGVVMYDGSYPIEISSQFGEEQYGNAVGGAHGNKYYISMKDSENRANFFVYDVTKKIWHREDETDVLCFCSSGNDIYFIDNSDKSIRTVLGTGEEQEDRIPWMIETGIIGTDSPDRKYVSRVTVRMSLDIGSEVAFSIQYDSSGDWVPCSRMIGTNLRSFSIPIKPRRCDHFRLRIEGEGDVKIFSIAKTIEIGSEVY